MGNRGYFDLFPQSEVLRRLKKALCFPAEDISIFRDPKNGDVRNKTRYSRHIKTVMFLQRSEIIEGHIMPDHIHILVSIPPKMSVSSFMGYLKGKSALMIFD